MIASTENRIISLAFRIWHRNVYAKAVNIAQAIDKKLRLPGFSTIW